MGNCIHWTVKCCDCCFHWMVDCCCCCHRQGDLLELQSCSNRGIPLPRSLGSSGQSSHQPIQHIYTSSLEYRDEVSLQPLSPNTTYVTMVTEDEGHFLPWFDTPRCEVTNETTTSLTLMCTLPCSLKSAFSEAQRVKPGLKELSLIAKLSIGTSLTGPKIESLETLKIKGKGRGMDNALQLVAHFCPKLKELELTFTDDYCIEGVDMSLSTCHSLRVLKLTRRDLRSVEFITLMDIVAAHFPNIRQLSVSVDQYKISDGGLGVGITVQLQHLDVLEFACHEIDQDAEQHLQQTVRTYYPNLVNTKTKDGVYFFRRIQGASEYMDEDGGELSIPAYNVNLSIPAGALEESANISIEVFSELPTGVCLQDNEIVASLGFRCFPSGLTFKKPLTLSMPHCAVLADHGDIRMILHFGNGEDEVIRIPLEINEYVIHDDRIELHIRHFSWGIPTMIYNWLFPGERADRQATKRMLCTPFIPTTLPEDQNRPILHLCIYNHLPGLPKEIIEEEKSMNYVKIYPEQELIVKEDSIDMSIICESEDLPREHSEKKELFTKDLMQLSKITVGIKLPQRKSMVTLIIRQERKITMEFWPGVKESNTPVPEVVPSIVRHECLTLTQASPGIAERRSPPPTVIELPVHRVPIEDIGALIEGGAPASPLSLVPFVRSHDAEIYMPRRHPGCLTDDQLEKISRQLPLNMFNAISVQLDFSATETENIRSSSNIAQNIYFTMLTKWQERTGARKTKLVKVLKNVKLKGIVQSLDLEIDDSPEEID